MPKKFINIPTKEKAMKKDSRKKIKKIMLDSLGEICLKLSELSKNDDITLKDCYVSYDNNIFDSKFTITVIVDF